MTDPSPPNERGVTEPLPRGKTMTNATPKQLAYIQRLADQNNKEVPEPLKELTTRQASRIIDELKNNHNSNVGSKSARIGLAFKVCYQRWSHAGANIFSHKDHFTQNVLETYQLLDTITQKIEAD
jgi:hypothetical protein